MEFPNNKVLYSVIAKRHSVRHYLPPSIPEEISECIENEIRAINERCGYSFKLVVDEPRSFKNIFAYGKFSNVRNYIIVSAPKGDDESRGCGVEGERLVLGLQAMGLNTCWVGLSYSKISKIFDVPSGHKIRCVIAFGYGATQGVVRRSKSVEELSNYEQGFPEWFLDGIKAVMEAPTAINQQKFKFELQSDGLVKAQRLFSLVGYTHIDLGIAICHFMLAAPKCGHIKVL